MNSIHSTQLCRLCLETSSGLVNVFEQFEDSTIASVLATYFWFQIHKDDGMSKWVCETCWTHTKTFHRFYKELELRHQNHVNSIVLVQVDEIKRERSGSPIEGVVEADLNVVKHEDDMDVTSNTDYMHTSAEEDSSDGINRKNDIRLAIDDEDEAFNENPNSENIIAKSKKFLVAKDSPSEVDRQVAEIGRFFRMKCEICSNDVEFDSLGTMRKHYRQLHKKTGYLVCCGTKYEKRRSMLDHIQYHINPEAHRCDQCGKSFKETKTLKAHLKSHILPHKCSVCSKTYASAIALKYHVRDKHSETSPKFHCDLCGKTYPTKYLLSSHIKNYHEPTLGHVCDGCGRKFKSKSDMEYHIQIKHSSTPPPKAQCDICGTWVKHKRYLRFHLRLHQETQDALDGNSDVLNCPICKKKVQNKRLLANHIRSNHGKRKHQCTFCDKAFRTPTSLKEHTALHTGVDLYSCTYCDRTFKSNANMYSHRKKAHVAEWTRDRVNTTTEETKVDREEVKEPDE